MAKSQLLRLEAAQRLTAGPKNLMLTSWKLFTKQIMTSNEDAEIRKHVYKPLKRGSPTPLYYPLVFDVDTKSGFIGQKACRRGRP